MPCILTHMSLAASKVRTYSCAPATIPETVELQCHNGDWKQHNSSVAPTMGCNTGLRTVSLYSLVLFRSTKLVMISPAPSNRRAWREISAAEAPWADLS
jgi:hypothetical protein